MMNDPEEQDLNLAPLEGSSEHLVVARDEEGEDDERHESSSETFLASHDPHDYQQGQEALLQQEHDGGADATNDNNNAAEAVVDAAAVAAAAAAAAAEPATLSSQVAAAAAVAAATIAEPSHVDEDALLAAGAHDVEAAAAVAAAAAAAAASSSLPPSPPSPPVDAKPPAKPSARSSARHPHVMTDARGIEKTFGSALGLLTRKFMDMVMASETGMVDMNISAVQLGVPKRRIYDITNVLEGVGMIEKRSKNTVAWKGSEAILGDSIDPDAKQKIEDLRADLSTLEREDQLLDSWISTMSRNQVISQSVSTDDIVEAIFYPVGGDAASMPTKESVLDETGKPKCVLIAVQPPFSSYAHMAPIEEGGPERQLYVGNEAGLAKYNVKAPPAGSKRQSPFALTTGRAFKTARTDERSISVYVLPTFFDDKDQKLKTTGIRLLSDDPYALDAQAASTMDKNEDDNDDHNDAIVNDGVVPEVAAEVAAEVTAEMAAASGALEEVEESKRQRTSSWDVAESMANDEGVSQFFEGDTGV